jgi:hypothetical protein
MFPSQETLSRIVPVEKQRYAFLKKILQNEQNLGTFLRFRKFKRLFYGIGRREGNLTVDKSIKKGLQVKF